MIESMRREMDRRVAVGLMQPRGLQCADQSDSISETTMPTHTDMECDPSIQYLEDEAAWAVYCTCTFRSNVEVGNNVDFLTRQRKGILAREVAYKHLLSMGKDMQAAEFADYYRIKK